MTSHHDIIFNDHVYMMFT